MTMNREDLAQIERNIHLSTLDESTLSRVWQHTMDPDTAFVLMSASRGERTEDENVKANIMMAAEIRALGYGYFWLKGYYIENYKEGSTEDEIEKMVGAPPETKPPRKVVEDSLFVIGRGVENNEKMRAQLMNLARSYNQDSILFKPAGADFGYVVYKDGTTGKPMTLHLDRMGEIYSKLRFGSHSNRNFKFEAAGTASDNLSKYFKSRLRKT